MPVRILIVDDHEIVREGIRTLINRSRPEWEIVGEGTSGEQAIEMCKTLKPDVLILDITMPGISGLETARTMTELGLQCRILMFTMHESDRLNAEVRQAGAQGLVLKSQAARDLIRAIDSLLAGGTFFEVESASEGNAPAGTLDSGTAPEQSSGQCRRVAIRARRGAHAPALRQIVTKLRYLSGEMDELWRANSRVT